MVKLEGEVLVGHDGTFQVQVPLADIIIDLCDGFELLRVYDTADLDFILILVIVPVLLNFTLISEVAVGLIIPNLALQRIHNWLHIVLRQIWVLEIGRAAKLAPLAPES